MIDKSKRDKATKLSLQYSLRSFILREVIQPLVPHLESRSIAETSNSMKYVAEQEIAVTEDYEIYPIASESMKEPDSRSPSRLRFASVSWRIWISLTIFSWMPNIAIPNWSNGMSCEDIWYISAGWHAQTETIDAGPQSAYLTIWR